MQNYALTIDGSNRGTLAYLDKGYVMNCVITNPGDITCLNNGVLHMSNCTGNPSLKGRFFVGSYVTFSGNVTVIDSIMSSGATPVSIVGAIRNRGVVTGNLALDVAGDITNEATWNTLGTTNLYTNGGNRKIKGVFDAALVMNQTGTPPPESFRSTCSTQITSRLYSFRISISKCRRAQCSSITGT